MRLLLCAAVLAATAAGFISNGALLLAHDVADTGRRLLQASRRPCPVDIAAANYTVLTSRCRRCVWPPFEPTACCAPFKDLACPYAVYINDVNGTDCADTLFWYIRLHGNYPPGVLYDNCREGPKGLKCSDDQGTQ